MSADEKRLLATSISGIRGRTIERATAMTYPTALRPGDPGYTPPPTFPPVPTPTPGIFAAGVPQLFFDTYRVQNVWGGAEDDKRLTFWAGAGLKDPLQGLLVEAKAANDGTGSFDYSYYPTSNASGIIRIIGEQGTTLLLEAVNGDRFTFDRASRTYVGGVDSSQRRFDLQQGRFVSITGIGSAVIYIGTAPTNPTELLMLMLTKSENVPPQGAPLVVAPIPQRLGAIRSMRQNYAQLQIEGTNGETLVFDLNKQQFTTDTPIPTITPSPTETPLVLTPSP
ncbi:MAG: hypothetical protein MUD01_28380 [Chloroflexaceae bacterium]|nr:hypothetical protein [Chloroflexaceae bacterium]